MPRAASAGSTCSCVWIAGSRTVRSSCEHLRLRRAVAHRVRAVRVGRHVHVGDRDHAARRRLDEDVHAVAVRRVDDREAGDDVVARRCAYQPSALAMHVGVALGLLQADDVGAGQPDHVLDAAAGSRGSRPRPGRTSPVHGSRSSPP